MYRTFFKVKGVNEVNSILEISSFLIRYKGATTAQEIYNIVQSVFYVLNIIMMIFMFVCYAHQFFHAFVGLFTKSKKWPEAKKNHKYAYIISARNEAKVIPYLIDSIYEQDYPRELMQVFVVADNCTDNTAEVAQEHGAIVYKRKNNIKVGKSYALDYILHRIMEDKAYDDFEAFFVFDADNLVSSSFTKEMNKLFDSGVEVATSFRDSKNFAKNWITAGQGFSFYRECLLLHHSRSLLGMGTFISGTGFFVKRDVLVKYDGWKFNTMVEDIEFSLNCAIDGIKIEYCEDAVFYDEQPESLKVSLNQRLRWCKGTHQCFAKYDGRSGKKCLLKPSQTRFELAIHVAPVPIILFAWSIITFLVNTFYFLIKMMPLEVYLNSTLLSLFNFFFGAYCMFLFFSACCSIKYGKKMKASKGKIVLYTFTFPLFMAFYLPLSMTALFKKVKWTPIPHDDAVSIELL